MTLATRYLRSLLVVGLGGLLGCAVPPPPSPSAAVGVAGMAGHAGMAGVAPNAAPMTLPRYLGIESIASGARRVVYRSRLRMSAYIPALEPHPMAAAPMALGDPACAQSPAPAVAAAATIQQAEATAPGKVKALSYLATIDCARNPQVEESLLAGMEDPSDRVRVAAVQAILTGMERCSRCSSNCCSCGGCCTFAIHEKLQKLAFGVDDRGCPCEPNPQVRRLARIALSKCSSPSGPPPLPVPEEIPSPQVIEMLQLPPPKQ